MGRTATTAITVVVGLASLAACAGDADESSGGGAAATEAPMSAGDEVVGAPAAEGEGGSADRAPAETVASGDGAAPSNVASTIDPTGTLAIAASAAVAVDDVTAAVDTITTAVDAAGGRVTSADVDYVAGAGEEPDRSTARLVLDVPPDELATVMDTVERLGTVTNYDQLAEDVAEQLTDLDVRIANERASIARVRELVDSAGTLQDLVFLEAELTSRETQLETLLATQRNLVERVAMSTLTLAITTAVPTTAIPPTLGGEIDTSDGLADAFATGWDTLTGALFAVVLVLAVLSPFFAVALGIGSFALVVRRFLRRTRTPSFVPDDVRTSPDTTITDDVSANRPG